MHDLKDTSESFSPSYTKSGYPHEQMTGSVWCKTCILVWNLSGYILSDIILLVGFEQLKRKEKRSEKENDKDDDDLGDFVLKVAKELEADKPGTIS